jgi:hypothetical protein
VRHRARQCVGLVALLMAALILAACNSGSSSGTAAVSSSPTTGSVGILLTDGPTDQFCSIMLIVNAVKLISDEGHVTIFEGSRRVDLLDLRDNNELITVGRRVPAGTYEKIRLEIDNKEVRLFECDDDGDRIFPPEIADVPSGKIDLNPRGEFDLEGGSLMLIQLDMDAEKSIHAHQTGNGMKWKFRPVVFVDIFTANAPDRLVRLTGTIENIASDPDRFDLCDSHVVSRPLNGDSGPRVMTADNDDNGNGDNGDDPDRDTCVEIRVVEATSIFLEEAEPGEFGDLEEGRTATVLGRFLLSGEDLRVLAELVQQDPDTVEKVRGTIASKVVEGVFELEVDPDQIADLPEDLIDVLIQKGTKIYSRRGELLDPEKVDPIQLGRRARVVGFVDLTEGEEQIYSTVIVVDLSEDPLESTSGTFLSWDETEREMQLDSDPAIVCVPEEANVYLGQIVEGSVRFKEVPDPSVFTRSVTEVTALGRTNAEDCLEASTVIGFDQEVSIP